jgi:hypothetical protein
MCEFDARRGIENEGWRIEDRRWRIEEDRDFRSSILYPLALAYFLVAVHLPLGPSEISMVPLIFMSSMVPV